MSALIWSYDGSLKALLVLVTKGLKLGKAPDQVIRTGVGPSKAGQAWLFSEGNGEINIERPSEGETEDARTKLLALSRRLYSATLKTWMSEEEREADLVEVALDCASRGEKALGDYSRPSLSRLAATVRRVSKETHLLEGFARFAPNRQGIYVACLEPEFNVLPALAPFFLGRFGCEPFALLDLKRGYGLLASSRTEGKEEGGFLVLEGQDFTDCLPDEGGGEEAELWRLYFSTVENKSRHNPLLQRQLMPRRYWNQLTEFGGR